VPVSISNSTQPNAHTSVRLGAHVRRCADDDALNCPGHRQCVAGIGGVELGQTKVQHLQRSVRCDLDVGRFQIAMDDALLVRGIQRIDNLCCEPNHVGQRQRSAPCDAVRQRFAVDQFEDQRDDRALLAGRVFHAIDRADVGMGQCRERLRFALESRSPAGVGGEFGRQYFDRDFASQPSVVRAVDLAHAAGPQETAELVAANPSGQRWDSMAGRVVGWSVVGGRW
jgi:hypothetical protein